MSFYSKVAVFASFFVRRASSPTGNENALVVRNIPSGIQAVSITAQNPGTPLNQFNSVTSVPSGASVLISSYTVPPAHTVQLVKIDVSGSNIASYDIILNGNPFGKLRTYFGGGLEASLDCGQSGINLVAGDTLEVHVTNFRPTIGDFESRVQLVKV